MKIIEKVKNAYERGERVNAIKAMKKEQRSEEQIADLQEWRKEEVRNTLIITGAVIAGAILKSRRI